MSKYRKKPVVIEAMVFNDLDDYLNIVKWYESKPESNDVPAVEIFSYTTNIMRIQTLEGIMNVSPGDYVIRGVKGEYYPCKPDIFEETYESVDE